MNKFILSCLLSLSTLLAACSTTDYASAIEPDIKVMTFNIRNGIAKDGDNHWSKRKEFVSDVIKDYSPDILGLQEAFRFQMDFLNDALPEYAEIGEGRNGGTEDEYSAILYRKNKYTALESGTFWLSDTPNVPSTHWGNSHLRICTWARLSEIKSKRSFYVYNTHLDHRSQLSRENSIRLISKYIDGRKHKDPVILCGDFNAGEGNSVIKFIKGKLAEEKPMNIFEDSFRTIFPDEKTVGTGNRFTGRSNGGKIDYVFITPGLKVLDAAIIRTNRNGRYPSDHYPVTADLSYNKVAD